MKDEQKYREYLLELLETVHSHLYEFPDLDIWVKLCHEVKSRVVLDPCIEERIRDFIEIHLPFSADPEPFGNFCAALDKLEKTEEPNRMLLI